MQSLKKYALWATLVLAAVLALVSVVDYLKWAAVPAEAALALRWTTLAALLAYTVTRRNLTAWIIFAMFAGIAVGHDLPAAGDALDVLSKIFLRLIKTIIGPLLFGTLVVGIAGHSNLKQVGRMGWKSLVYFEVVTTLALIIGLAAINLTQAGAGIEKPETLAAPPEVHKRDAKEIILHTFPENIAKSVANGETLQIVVFSILFGIGLAMVAQAKRGPMLSFAESLSETMFKFTDIVMLFAPLGIFGAMASTVSHMGLGVLVNLFMLLATLYAALVVFVLGVLLPVALIVRVPIKKFVQAISEPVSIAFATASSEAALPRALEAVERFGVPRKIVAFVLPTGYSFNLDGSTLYLALATVFVAQAAGVNLSIGEQMVIVFTLMLSSKGVAGIARGTFIIILGTLASFNLPLWPAMAILGIDQLMDMARTAVNVTGNCLACVVVARWEGEFDDAKANAWQPVGKLHEIKE
jgi:proton glutamate symport protein